MLTHAFNTEPNNLKIFPSYNMTKFNSINKEPYILSLKFSKLALPYSSINNIILQIEYNSKFYRYDLSKKNYLHLPNPNIYNSHITLKIHLLYPFLQNLIIIGKGTLHLYREYLNLIIFNKIIKIALDEQKLNEIGIGTGLNNNEPNIEKKQGKLFVEGSLIKEKKVKDAINTNFCKINGSKLKFKNKKKIKSLKKAETKAAIKRMVTGNENKNKEEPFNENEKISYSRSERNMTTIEFQQNDEHLYDFINTSEMSEYCLTNFDSNNTIEKNEIKNINFNQNKLLNCLQNINNKRQLIKKGDNILIQIGSEIKKSHDDLKNMNKKYVNSFIEKNSKLKEKGIENANKYIWIKKNFVKIKSEFEKNQKEYEKKKSEVKNEISQAQKQIQNINKETDKYLNDLFNSIFCNNINLAKSKIEKDINEMVNIVKIIESEHIDILKGLTELEKKEAIFLLGLNRDDNSNIDDESRKTSIYSYNNGSNQRSPNAEEDSSSEDEESNKIIKIIEKCVNTYYNKKLIPKIQIEQIDTYHYSFEDLKIELVFDPEDENNLITSCGENFELWLVNHFSC